MLDGVCGRRFGTTEEPARGLEKIVKEGAFYARAICHL
jgi:hypothetical protein